jgi:hypothetical protein
MESDAGHIMIVSGQCFESVPNVVLEVRICYSRIFELCRLH